MQTNRLHGLRFYALSCGVAMGRFFQGCVKPAGKRVLGLDESPKSEGPKSETSPNSNFALSTTGFVINVPANITCLESS
jgi:hypothetical protein